MLGPWIYRSSDITGLKECYNKVNLDLERMHEWATANGLRLNRTKIQVILIHRRRPVIPPPALSENNISLNYNILKYSVLYYI
jgi:hypothetical protein